MKAEKIELKQIKHFFELSEETNAFSAKLYVNGILTADCSDTGKGGCIDIRVIRGKEALLAAAESYTGSIAGGSGKLYGKPSCRQNGVRFRTGDGP